MARYWKDDFWVFNIVTSGTNNACDIDFNYKSSGRAAVIFRAIKL